MKLVRPSTAPVPTPKRAREPWRPNNEPYVLGSCGHTCLGWGEFRALRPIISHIWCDVCRCWVTIKAKKVTPAEMLGLTILPLPEEPPF